MVRILVAIMLAINLALYFWITKEPENEPKPTVGGDLKLLSEVEATDNKPKISSYQTKEPATDKPGQAPSTVQVNQDNEQTQPISSVAKLEEAPAKEDDKQDSAILSSEPVIAQPAPESPQENRLAEEVDPEIQPKVKERSCYSYGPLPDRLSALGVMVEIRRTTEEPRLRQDKPGTTSGYWVLIETAKTDADAVKLVESLKAAGISDIWRITRGELKNAISMGLFSRQENAEKRATEARSKGFTVNIVDKPRKAPVFWIDFRSENPALTINDLGMQKAKNRSLRSIACPKKEG